MEHHGSGPGDRQQGSNGAQSAVGRIGLFARLFGGAAGASPGRVRRRSDAGRLRELPDHLLDDIGLPPRSASARYRGS